MVVLVREEMSTHVGAYIEHLAAVRNRAGVCYRSKINIWIGSETRAETHVSGQCGYSCVSATNHVSKNGQLCLDAGGLTSSAFCIKAFVSDVVTALIADANLSLKTFVAPRPGTSVLFVPVSSIYYGRVRVQ